MRMFFPIVLTFAGCVATVPKAPEVEVRLVPTSSGLQVLPDGREIGFGRDWRNVVAVMTRLRGAPDDAAACDGRAARWGGLVLRHDGQRFVGIGCG